MGRIEMDWVQVFHNSSTDHTEGICLRSPSSAPHAAAVTPVRAGPAAGEEGVARASSGDEQPRGAQAHHLRLEALCSELERRVGELRPAERSPVTRAAAKAAAVRGQDAHSAAENVHDFNQEDRQGEHVACKSCLKPSPVLVSRKKNHEQAAADLGEDAHVTVTAHSVSENVHNFNQEDGQGEHVACKSCLKPSPVLVSRKKNHEQAAADLGEDAHVTVTAHSVSENVHNFNQEDGQGEHVACKSCLKPSPVLVSRKKNHEQAAADLGEDAHVTVTAHSVSENVHNFNQEDGQGEHVAYKSCLKPSPVLVSRKKNHEQADGDRKCKRVTRPSTKNVDKKPAPPEEIFEVLRVIPSLYRADLLTAYSMLIRDDRLFRSLVALPEDMRKDWLLMEISRGMRDD